MQAIRGADTRPERAVRRLAHALGYRFRLHRKDLPGTPDIVFPRLGSVVLVHGCFWHQHEQCIDANVPRSNTAYWLPKLERNKQRDLRNRADLEALGWRVLVIWECELRSKEAVRDKLCGFLSGHCRE